jgi:hypothetical protein
MGCEGLEEAGDTGKQATAGLRPRGGFHVPGGAVFGYRTIIFVFTAKKPMRIEDNNVNRKRLVRT